MYKIKCNRCGYTQYVGQLDNLTCPCCANQIDKALCLDSDSLHDDKYFDHKAKILILQGSFDGLNKLALNMEEENSSLGYAKIYKERDRLKAFIDNYSSLNKELSDFIYYHDIVINYPKDRIIEEFKDNSDLASYLEYFNEKDDSELLDKLLKIDTEYFVSKKEVKQINLYALIVFGVSLLIGILCAIILNFIRKEELRYPLIILIEIVPIAVMTISFMKIINKKSILLGIVIFLLSFYLLTYLYTIRMHDGTFLESFGFHLKRIVFVIKDLSDGINKYTEIIGEDV